MKALTNEKLLERLTRISQYIGENCLYMDFDFEKHKKRICNIQNLILTKTYTYQNDIFTSGLYKAHLELEKKYSPKIGEKIGFV